MRRNIFASGVTVAAVALVAALITLGAVIGAVGMWGYQHSRHHSTSVADDMRRMGENLACSEEEGRPGCAQTVTEVRQVSPDFWRISYNDPQDGPSCLLISSGGSTTGSCRP